MRTRPLRWIVVAATCGFGLLVAHACRAGDVPGRTVEAPAAAGHEGEGREGNAREASVAARETAPLPTTRVTFANPDGQSATFVCEVAATPEAREIGLMHRRTLASGRGMVFVFPVAEQQGFWMKNTYIPLDMVFVGPDRTVIGVVENARPLTLELRTIPGAARYVVELVAFAAREHGIRAGTRVAFDPPLPDVQR
jgi:uncharacterized membrane protein (UPF0127 family)